MRVQFFDIAVGADGTGEKTVWPPVGERLVAIEIDYADGQGVGTDVIVTSRGREVFRRSNSNTDGIFQPREQAVDSAAAAIAGEFVTPVLRDGQLRVRVEGGADSGSNVGVTVRLFTE